MCVYASLQRDTACFSDTTLCIVSLIQRKSAAGPVPVPNVSGWYIESGDVVNNR